jgi:hypothetical protein
MPGYFVLFAEFSGGASATLLGIWPRGAAKSPASQEDHGPARGPARQLVITVASEAPDAAGTHKVSGIGTGPDRFANAIEVSQVACEKAEQFARAEQVTVNVRNEPIETARLTGAPYDLVLMNGSLHYVRDKHAVLRRVLDASAADAVHAVAVFSTATPVPAEHTVIPVFPDDEGGLIEEFYQDWGKLWHAYERGQAEHSHPGFAPHLHSHVKLVAARIPKTEGH